MDRSKSYMYDMKEIMVIPQAWKVLRLRPERRFCRLGDLSTEVVCKDCDLVQRLETRSKQPTQVYLKKSLPLEVVRKVDAVMIPDEKDLLSKARGL